MLQYQEKLSHMKARQRQHILQSFESAIHSALRTVEFWKEREDSARRESPAWFVYIANAKKRRKQAQSDVEYWREKVAQFVQENKIPYVLMSA
jgi:hypothetical protein